ncbi:MAG: YciI family protein [Acidimicrobiales bacterium]
MKYVMFYETEPDTGSLAREHLEAHRAYFMEFHRRGLLLMTGPFVDAEGGAIGIFTTREAAEEFVEGDPFVRNGVIARWSIRQWNEVLAP